MSFATLDADVAAWLVTQSLTRMAADLRSDQNLTAGSNYFQLRVDPIENIPRSSSDDQAFADATVVVWHALADWTDERAYTTGARLTLLDTLTKPEDWIAGAAAVHEVRNIEAGQVARVGHLIRFQVSARVGLTPA